MTRWYKFTAGGKPTHYAYGSQEDANRYCATLTEWSDVPYLLEKMNADAIVQSWVRGSNHDNFLLSEILEGESAALVTGNDPDFFTAHSGPRL